MIWQLSGPKPTPQQQVRTQNGDETYSEIAQKILLYYRDPVRDNKKNNETINLRILFSRMQFVFF